MPWFVYLKISRNSRLKIRRQGHSIHVGITEVIYLPPRGCDVIVLIS